MAESLKTLRFVRKMSCAIDFFYGLASISLPMTWGCWLVDHSAQPIVHDVYIPFLFPAMDTQREKSS